MTSTESLSHEPLPDSTRTGTEVDLLASALHHALQGVTPPRHTDPALKHSSIEIIVDSDTLILRGTGAEVSPALLSGYVVLHLAESTPVKQITLQFRGKAKLPPLANEPFSNSAMTYTLCNHEWSFLEGEKKHSHTLKAGRHLFPFQLHVGGSLPSTLYTDAYGGASVAYKLRAIATRPGFAHNLHTQQAITLLRSFGPDAFEYQQSLEIENTWPEKLMYSIMIPHKAWAAGDNLTAIVKFSPLAKGVRVLSVVTTLNETIKTSARSSRQESTKALIEVMHEFHNGQAVYVVHRDQDRDQDHSPRTRSRVHSGPTTPGASGGSLPLHSPEASPSTSTRPVLPRTESRSEIHSAPVAVDFELSEGDIATRLEICLPAFTTPTHTLEPIIASHRIRWNIHIANLDGHTSKLRCSLPLHILDGRLLDEAISATAATRQLLLGGPEVPDEQDPDTVLPSYPSHIRDRVANVYMPDQAALRVTNPWLQHGISPVQQHETDHDGRHSSPTSGAHTPLEAYYVPSSLGGHGDPELEYVNSELLLSLSQNAPRPVVESPSSRPGSSRASRAPSRTHSPSPDREREREPRSRRSSGGSSVELGASTFVHESNSASRNLHGVFHVTMKPLTSLSFAIPTRHHPHTHPHSPLHQPLHHLQPHQHSPPPRTVPVTSHSLLHRAFTEVPDYGISSRGFLGGGVTPLETLQGLPSYEEAEMQRSRSESDLAAMAHQRPDPSSRLAVTGPPSPSSTLPVS
ncbi:hypothetical protein EDB92DRAFT_1943226 [Lactarius akahatsu]|uniref:Arrestin C-terminal-like domain-containing protein n=1 Tax=Lactarius akahatsu TaxID=416441 RepID=A0AAD4QFL2_9AGAM|nr:hypothetical protein EDB92DRAFT_1943226 [Lactarius akahatsu]